MNTVQKLFRQICILLLVLFAASIADLRGPNRRDQVSETAASDQELLDGLCSASWPIVTQSVRKIKDCGAEGVPVLIEAMSFNSKAKLVNTFDLIYPGADEFYGHGYIVPYDIDWLPVRAGWALEEIAFQDFGFREPEDAASLTDSERMALRTASVAKARTWWSENQKDWTRLKAIENALTSDSPRRQEKALSYLRYPDSQCPGLDREFYKTNLRPIVEKLAVLGDDGHPTVRNQACHLIGEIPDERRSYCVDGLVPGMTVAEARRLRPGLKTKPGPATITGETTLIQETIATVEDGRIVRIEGQQLFDGKTLIAKTGDSLDSVLRRFVPYHPADNAIFIGAYDSRNSVVAAIDEKTSTLSRVEIQGWSLETDTWRPSWQLNSP